MRRLFGALAQSFATWLVRTRVRHQSDTLASKGLAMMMNREMGQAWNSWQSGNSLSTEQMDRVSRAFQYWAAAAMARAFNTWIQVTFEVPNTNPNLSLTSSHRQRYRIRTPKNNANRASSPSSKVS